MYLIGIAGGSGSGKTTFAYKIIQQVSHSQVVLLHQDSYYLASPQEQLKVNGTPNFDHPDAFDWPLLKEHLTLLKAGQPIEAPTYDFKNNRRAKEKEKMGPCRVIIFEGIFALYEQSIREVLDLSVFLNVESDIRFIRRLHRDIQERGRTVDSVITQYYDTVRPMHQKHLEPTKQFADLVVGEETDKAAEVLAAKVKETLGKSK